jgi:hypothetical protein
MFKHSDAIAYGYDEDGLKKLVAIIGINCRSKLEWRNSGGQPCKAPSSIRDEWQRVVLWIEANIDS